ncbi:MAG TPA: heavy-metal-associated domain-containing protein [Clostridiaceae bacterium]|nr:heavy-metal-associated domain-containing protein [Clostridiaceae bacterium]
MKEATLNTEPLTSPSCVEEIENAAKAVNGVDQESVNVLIDSNKVKFDYDPEKVSIKDIENAITALGYLVVNVDTKEKESE